MTDNEMMDFQPPKEPSVRKDILAVLALVLVAFVSGFGGGFLAVKMFYPAGPATQITGPVKPGPDGNITGPQPTPEVEKKPGLLEFETFLTHLPDPFGRRYIEVEFKLELAGKELVETIKRKSLLMAKLRHEIYDLLGKRNYRDLKTASGKISVMEEIQIRINEILKEEMGIEPVTKLYATTWRLI